MSLFERPDIKFLLFVSFSFLLVAGYCTLTDTKTVPTAPPAIPTSQVKPNPALQDTPTPQLQHNPALQDPSQCPSGFIFSEKTCQCIADTHNCVKNSISQKTCPSQNCIYYSRSGSCACPMCENMLYQCLPK